MEQAELFSQYLQSVAEVRKEPEATPELSLREPLLRLLRELAAQGGRSLLIAPEATAGEAGQPDVFLKDGPRLVGFVETKAPGAALASMLRRDAQLKRYRESLPNWLLTDYFSFVFVREGEVVGRIELADSEDLKAPPPTPTRHAELVSSFDEFFAYAAPVIRSPGRLAQELARRGRLLRDGLVGALDAEPPGGPLRGVLRFYRETLMSDLDEAGFADTFAQTIAYGMFLARLHQPEVHFRREMVATAVPHSVPFLRSAVRLLTDPELLPAALLRLLDDLAAMLDNTQVDALREEVAAGGLERDLVVYFYERFLEQYDKGERRDRGVYYTAPEMVGYLTRMTERVLERDFGLERGLADPRVMLLDPATGTGTFLLGMAERALEREAERGSASQRRLIREHLLRNFSGFELLPAPYAIAHLKLASFYEQAGYTLTGEERLPIYLTNTLQAGELGEGAQLAMLPMLRGIVDEAQAAGRIKAQTPVLVVCGNPPYERTGHNANEESDRLIESFYALEGARLPDRNTGPLRDDYLRFIRWSVWKLLEQSGAPGHGVLALVTNRAYIERRLHRAARRFLLERFDEILVFDLHGDQREWFADRVDNKVFRDVQAGIALSVFIKRPGPGDGLATVRYREQFGTRDEKLLACRQGGLEDSEWRELTPRRPLWLFTPYDVPATYDRWPSVAQLFPRNVIGVQTHRDQLVVAASERELRARLARFADLEVPDAEWIRRGVRSNRDWGLQEARQQLNQEGPRRIMRWAFRPFDRRWVAFDERLIDYTRTRVSPHLVDHGQNLALAFSYGSLPDGPYAFVARSPVPAALLSWRTFGQAYFAPLCLYEPLSSQMQPNLPPGLLGRLADRGIQADPEGLLYYTYAVLNAPTYRSRFAHGLRHDFGHIPLAKDPEVFASLQELGQRLASLHLLEDPELEKAAPLMDGDDRAILEQPAHDALAQSIQLAASLTARPVSAAAWAYQQGSYPVVRTYLEARNGRSLEQEEFDEFRVIVAAVTLTLSLLPRIDDMVAMAAASAFDLQDLGFASPR